MYKIAICDDDKEYRAIVKGTIENADEIRGEEILFYEYESGGELIKNVGIAHHLIFIDVRMPGMDGNKTAQLFRETNKEAVLVFCSNYFEPTPDSINKGQPFRYIMKDLQNRTLKNEMKNILLEMKRRNRMKYLTVTAVSKITRLPIKDILYISVAKRGCIIYRIKNKQMEEIHCRESMKELYGQLNREGFEYAHNSYIVNLENVIGIEKAVLFLQGGIQLNISRSKKAQFEERLMNFLRMGSGIE